MPIHQHCVRRKWKQNMKKPVLEYWTVNGLHSNPPSHDNGVNDSTDAYKTPNNRYVIDRSFARVVRGTEPLAP